MSQQTSGATAQVGQVYLSPKQWPWDQGTEVSWKNDWELVQLWIPNLLEEFSLLIQNILFLGSFHPMGCDGKSPNSAGYVIELFQSKSGRMRPGGLGSTQLIQKLAQLAWYWCPP